MKKLTFMLCASVQLRAFSKKLCAFFRQKPQHHYYIDGARNDVTCAGPIAHTMANTSDFSALQAAITSSLVSTTKTTNQLASGDLPFHRSLDSSLATSLDRQNARLLSLASRLINTASTTSETVRPAPKLGDIEDVEGNWRAVVDVVDNLLERADTALDEFTGAVRRLSPSANTPEVESTTSRQGRKGFGVRDGQVAGKSSSTSWKSQEIAKPQLQFEYVPRNDEAGPFIPLLQTKPHALEPLKTKPDAVIDGDGEAEAQIQYAHPYQKEIEQYDWPAEVYEVREPIMYHPFESTEATFVDTEEAMYKMLDELKQAKEIAVDLEHHDQRSYIGIVSLMQISTRDKDWIVDTLRPWRRRLQALNEVFANPGIVKVLHGAFMDVMWLQRDLGLYLVGLFDTHYASRALGYPGGSYAYLLKRFADVDAQKQYQMADWRIRPLPQELLDYARSDTHYLLYIYDNMRNELIERSEFSKPNDKLHDVLVRSKDTALQRYEHPIYDYELGQGPMGWYKLLSRTPALLSREQFSVFRAVHKWRDGVAREQDDSIHFVMPNHQIFTIAKTLPGSRAELLGVAQPTTQTLRLRADELVGVILKAKQVGNEGLDMMDVMNQVEPQFTRRPAYYADAQPNHSVAPFVPQFGVTPTTTPAATPAKIDVPTASVKELRSETSAFWGPAFGKSARQQQYTVAPLDVDLHVPLPPLTAAIFADPSELGSTPIKPSTPASPVIAPSTEEKPEDDVFVLKQLGKKRKRPNSPEHPSTGADGMATQADEVTLEHGPEIERAREKAGRKKARKEAKRAAKQAAAQGGGGGDGDVEEGELEEEAPFDYGAAPSILNPPRESKQLVRDRKKKEVNPYSKVLTADNSKALPRVQKERAGKSMTFKNSPSTVAAFHDRFIRPCPRIDWALLITNLLEYLRGTATTDECEPLFKQYKTCLSKALKERGIDKMLEEARDDNKENDAEYLRPSGR
ncbi:HRDC domain [Teratosphaeria destructans]|uniref:HRDC domain n=1 Tax=Teratosphaeria destructans TaxID=418781 RepID=A0A9W7W114_9PEZI|nr:HRDC domain [Teratosphaeria destructans]